MDFITGTILSGAIYDIFKVGTQLTTITLKEKLKKWLIDDIIAEEIVQHLNKLELSGDMSESAIEGKIASLAELSTLLQNIKPSTHYTQINQNHAGSGDNVAGNKIIK